MQELYSKKIHIRNGQPQRKQKVIKKSYKVENAHVDAAGTDSQKPNR